MSSSFITDRFQFAEMNLRHTGDISRTMNMVQRAVIMGYDSIVINNDVGEIFKKSDCSPENEEPARKKKKKGRKVGVIPEPVSIDVSRLDTSMIELSGKHLRLFSRITVTLSDNNQLSAFLLDPKVHKYDLVAVRPATEQILQTLNQKRDHVDIITYEQTSEDVPWLQRFKVLQQCVNEGGLTFEITYSNALKDSSTRRDFLTNGRRLMQSTRGGRGVIIASGAEEMIEIRAPFDAANLTVLFGVRSEDARKFVAANARRALLKAETRKTIKGALFITNLIDMPKGVRERLGVVDKMMKIPEFQVQMEISKDETKDVNEQIEGGDNK